MQYPPTPHVPVDETQVSAFLAKNPTYDGRGTLIAVVDSGIDPLAHGLQVTTEGKRKVVDYIDCSGAGDVVMSEPMKSADGTLPGTTGRTLRLNPEWSNPTGDWRIGMKRMFDITPVDVRADLMRVRKTTFERDLMRLANDVMAKLDSVEGCGDSRELSMQKDVLDTLGEQYRDCGPVFDCVVFHDGDQWRAAIDTSETGDLSEAEAVGAYKLTGQIGMLSRRFLVAYTLNFYDDGQILSIVTCHSNHGTIAAGILAAYDSSDARNSGVAPGAQLVSINVVDGRLDKNIPMLSSSLALNTLVNYNVDLATTSLIGHICEPNVGHKVNIVSAQIIQKLRCIFVSAVGNSGPALSTVMSAGGTMDWVIGVGAYYSSEQIKDQFAICDDAKEAAFNFSSRGPAADGSRGVDIYAPGSAISSGQSSTRTRNGVAEDTSQAAPNLCGCLSLLVSAWKQEIDGSSGQKIGMFRIRNAILTTARQFGDDLGVGLIQTADAWEFLKKNSAQPSEDVDFQIRISELNDAHGIYLRNLDDSATPRALSVSIQAIHIESLLADPEVDKDEAYAEKVSKRAYDFDMRVMISATEKWVRVPDAVYVSSGSAIFDTSIDAVRLQAGRLHTAEIQGFDAQNVERGPVFSIPVVVTKPLTVGPSARIQFNGLHFKPEEVVRRFIAVPQGATRATITMRSPNKSTHAAAPARFMLNCVQMLPMHRFTSFHLNTYDSVGHASFAMSSDSAEQLHRHKMQVRGSETLEVCISPHWVNHDAYDLDVSVEFQGLVVAGAMTEMLHAFRNSPGITLSGDVPVNRVDLQSLVRTEDSITPACYLEKLQRFYRPTKASISVLRSERDMCLATRCPYYQLALEYAVSTTRDNTNAHIVVTGFGAKSDDFWAQGLQLLAFDARKRCILRHTGSSEKVCLPRRGDYTLRVQIRHHSAKELEVLRHLQLTVVFALRQYTSIQIRPSVEAVFDRKYIARYTRATIPKGKQLPLFFDTVSFKPPAEAQPGDVLVGCIMPKRGADCLALNYTVPQRATTKDRVASQPPMIVARTSGSSMSISDKERRELAEAMACLQIEWVKKVRDEDVRQRLIDDLLSESSGISDLNRMRVLTIQLELLDARRRTLPLDAKSGISTLSAAKIIHVSERIIALVDTSRLAITLSTKLPGGADTEDEARTKLDAAKSRDMLVSALMSKCRALAFQVSADRPAAALADYESAVVQLAKWSDNGSDLALDIEYLLAAVIPLHMGKQEYAHALVALSRWTEKAPMTHTNAADWNTVSALQIRLLDKLGWPLWVDNFKNRLAEECPGSFVPL